MKRARRMLAPAALCLTVGCAYFNGVYNANSFAHRGDNALRSGQEGEAATAFAASAARAETVLARHAKSRWRPDALYLAGRGEAYSNQCERGEQRLGEFLALPRIDPRRRDEATIAMAACFVHRTRYVDALQLLDPLTTAKDRTIAANAALWAARASIAMGRNDDAQRYLSIVGQSSAQWELAASAFSSQEYARAESLLTLRAADNDFRDDVLDDLRQLWAAGDRTDVERIAERYDRARVNTRDKVRVHMTVADLDIGARLDAQAQGHLLAAKRLNTDTTVDKEVEARLTLLQISRLDHLIDVERAIAHSEEVAKGSKLQRSLADNFLLVKMLSEVTDLTGASLFLAAEIARDSLHSPPLAYALYMQVVQTLPNTLMAPRALLAAGVVMPDSAAVFAGRVKSEYPTSPTTKLLDGTDPGDQPAYKAVYSALELAWRNGQRRWLDTLKLLHPAAPGAASTAADALKSTIDTTRDTIVPPPRDR